MSRRQWGTELPQVLRGRLWGGTTPLWGLERLSHAARRAQGSQVPTVWVWGLGAAEPVLESARVPGASGWQPQTPSTDMPVPSR